MRLALIVEYDGTNYSGFQYQTNAPSVQNELEQAITQVTGEKIRIKSAGRTDAGVHAVGQVAAFDTESRHTPETFVKAMNFYLPDDVAVKAAYRVAEDFDPRRNAVKRRYRYTIINSSTPSPLMRRWVCSIHEPLDVAAMRQAAGVFEGEHDFARFAAPLERSDASTVRRIYEAGISKSGDVMRFDVAGSAFLPHQVRRMAGALVDVGRGKLSIEDIGDLLNRRESGAVAHALPPQGLCLMKVEYDEFPPFS